jgi:hypothetical protein
MLLLAAYFICIHQAYYLFIPIFLFHEYILDIMQYEKKLDLQKDSIIIQICDLIIDFLWIFIMFTVFHNTDTHLIMVLYIIIIKYYYY